MSTLRNLPSIEHVLQTRTVQDFISSFGRPLTLDAIHNVLDNVRKEYSQGEAIPDLDTLFHRVEKTLQNWNAPTLQAVINATGVVLHTNLGRAPLSQAALRAIQNVSFGYSTLEFDLDKGLRGSRLVHAEALLQRLTGAQAALVVNNNAAAVLLVLTALAHRHSVVISRSQLVEIGGGFRVPDVMKQSGARLIEVGATNQVHLSDYESALEYKPALILRAHRSNFKIIGFTSEPTLEEMTTVAHSAGIPMVDDLGSGTLLDTTRFGLGHEPMVQESLAASADLVCFSGDKLLGGPQAGIILGRADLVARLKKHPLARAVRLDKLCLAALNATLLHYLKDEAEREIPIWRMISARTETLRLRAQVWANALGSNMCAGVTLPTENSMVIPGESAIGGGSLPGETLPTSLLALKVKNPTRFLALLRQVDPPIIARLQDDLVVLDPRTVLPEQDDVLLAGIRHAFNTKGTQ
jgi:L-seryl-tRNA(Ser) seleniumtransferase